MGLDVNSITGNLGQVIHTEDLLKDLRNTDVHGYKLSGGLKLYEDTEILSAMRVYYHEEHRMSHVFERPSIPSPLNPFINMSDSGEPFVAACAELLSGRTKFPAHRVAEFQQTQEFDYQETFAELRAVLTAEPRQYAPEETQYEATTIECRRPSYRR
jgi:hypothetical protein